MSFSYTQKQNKRSTDNRAFLMQERRGIVPKKLNDKQVSELVIEHANGTSISALAKKYGIDRSTARRYIDNAAELRQKYNAIKNETVTEWLDGQREEIKGLLNQIISLLPKKLKESNARDLMGAYKILIETSINNVESTNENREQITEISVEFEDASEGSNDEA